MSASLMLLICDRCRKGFVRMDKPGPVARQKRRSQKTYCSEECWRARRGDLQNTCGTYSSYSHRGCRCAACRAAKVKYAEARRRTAKLAVIRQIQAMTAYDLFQDNPEDSYYNAARKRWQKG